MSDDGPRDELAVVERSLWAAFVSRAILPGDRVIVEALAYQYKVSSPLLIRALESMANKGLVTRTGHSSFSARPLLTNREFAEIFVVRNRLEPWLAEEAGKTFITDEIADELRSLAAEPATPTLITLAEHDTAFHELIGRLSGLTFASRAVDSLNYPFHTYRRLDGHSYAPLSDNEHVEIAEALINGTPADAKVAMQKHLSSSSARLLALG